MEALNGELNGCNNKDTCVVCAPLPAQGHINPKLKLAKLWIYKLEWLNKKNNFDRTKASLSIGKIFDLIASNSQSKNWLPHHRVESWFSGKRLLTMVVGQKLLHHLLASFVLYSILTPITNSQFNTYLTPPRTKRT